MTTEGEKTTADPAGPARRTAKRAIVGRLSWGLADQAVSSLTQLRGGLYVARSLGRDRVRRVQPCLGHLRRGAQLLPRAGHRPARGALQRRAGRVLARGARRSTGTARRRCRVGAVCSDVVRARPRRPVGARVRRAWSSCCRSCCSRTPGGSRSSPRAPGRRRSSTTSIWAVALVPAMVVAPGAAAWSVRARLGRVAPRWRRGTAACSPGIAAPDDRVTRWLRDHRDLGARYPVENVSISGASQLRAYGLGAIVGARRGRRGARRRAPARPVPGGADGAVAGHRPGGGTGAAAPAPAEQVLPAPGRWAGRRRAARGARRCC